MFEIMGSPYAVVAVLYLPVYSHWKDKSSSHRPLYIQAIADTDTPR